MSFKSAAFATIGLKDANENKCVRLSDLKVTGYMDTMGGCWNGVYITMLRKSGANKRIDIGGGETMEVTYYWNEEEGGMEAGWYDPFGVALKDDASPLGNADEITLAAGESFVFTCESDYIGCKLISNGEVIAGAVDFPIADDGLHFIGNPLARKIKLSEITVDGYMGTMGGCWNGVYITVLRKSGANKRIDIGGGETMEVTYYWNEEEGGMEAGWYDPFGVALKDDASPLGNADEIVFDIGEGIAVTSESDYTGCVIHFPSLGLN